MPYLLGEPALVLSKLEGEEAFSTLYSYTITAKTPAKPINSLASGFKCRSQILNW